MIQSALFVEPATERDPRVDPRPGDVLERGGLRYEVLPSDEARVGFSVGQDRCPVHALAGLSRKRP